MDEVEKCVLEVNKILGSTTPEKTSSSKESKNTNSLLCIEHRNLNAEAELKRIFGSKVVQADQARLVSKVFLLRGNLLLRVSFYLKKIL